ncbi:hypothetical protein JDN41_14825 [Rhodomicrobium udaipurense]|uniref:Uncharacterized protein n=1 Tax=Rhodomicrobium udaipurense TaxID=1202716 RepID=A0A8I1KL03_9HYPH|nr:hypothetical protein [Rhodomicrobium udaipurense]
MNNNIFHHASDGDSNAAELPPNCRRTAADAVFLLTSTWLGDYCVRKPGSALSFFDVKCKRPDQTMEHIR